MRKKLIFGLLAICCCGAFLVGCSSDDGATPTAKTPIQLLNESTASRFESVWTQLNAKASNTDLSALANRVGTVEGSIVPDLTAYTAKDTELEGRLAGLESLNISATFTDILAEIAFLKLQSGTPTGTPTPTPICSVTKPITPLPADGATGIMENNIELRWSDCGANNYMLYVGINSSTNTSLVYNGAFTRYYYDGLLPNTYYYWKVIAVAPLGCEDQVSSWSFRTQ